MFKLASFNLRVAVESDGLNYLPNRIPLIKQKILQELPDVIGFQEIEDIGVELLSEALPDYWIVGPGRNKNWAGEGCRIALLKKTITLLALDQIWLSPTPRVPGSCFENQSNCPRVAVWVKILHRPSGKVFFYINTHLDHVSEEARIQGIEMVLALADRLKAEENYPVFISGDFNFSPENKPHEWIENCHYSDLTKTLGNTLHLFTENAIAKIDYILSDIDGEYRSSQWHECKDGVYLSDHDPVCVEVDV